MTNIVLNRTATQRPEFQLQLPTAKNSPLELVPSYIPFNQADVASHLKAEHTKLKKVNRVRHGLCEIISNAVLKDDLLGKATDSNFLRRNVTVENLTRDDIKNSHLLEVFSPFRKIVAIVFSIYPKNIFSIRDQWKLVGKPKGSRSRRVNTAILKKGLSQIDTGTTLKLAVFSKSMFEFSGHSLLIKKTASNRYTFFDPNTGEHRHLSLTRLAHKIDHQLNMWDGTDIFLMKGDDYRAVLEAKGLWS